MNDDNNHSTHPADGARTEETDQQESVEASAPSFLQRLRTMRPGVFWAAVAALAAVAGLGLGVYEIANTGDLQEEKEIQEIFHRFPEAIDKYEAGDNDALNEILVKTEDLLDRYPNDKRLHLAAGYMKIKTFEFQAAREHLQKILAQNEDNFRALVGMGESWADELQPEMAIPYFNDARVAANSENGRVTPIQKQQLLMLLAKAHKDYSGKHPTGSETRKSELRKAKGFAEEAISYNEKLPTAKSEPHLVLARIYWEEEHYLFAAAQYWEALKIDPDNLTVKEGLDKSMAAATAQAQLPVEPPNESPGIEKVPPP